MTLSISKLKKEDISSISKIHRECFPKDSNDYENSIKWITCNYQAFPRLLYYVAKDKEEIVGYILLMEKGGFRQEAVLELQEIGVTSSRRGEGIGTELIKQSIKDYQKILNSNNRTLKLIEIYVHASNNAQKLYKKILNAEQVAIIPDLYGSDEAILIARNINPK